MYSDIDIPARAARDLSLRWILSGTLRIWIMVDMPLACFHQNHMSNPDAVWTTWNYLRRWPSERTTDRLQNLCALEKDRKIHTLPSAGPRIFPTRIGLCSPIESW